MLYIDYDYREIKIPSTGCKHTSYMGLQTHSVEEKNHIYLVSLHGCGVILKKALQEGDLCLNFVQRTAQDEYTALS